VAHDVFLSYANADKTMADMVCATLEQEGIRCWMAPRDVRPGADWGGSIVAAIRASRAMVLVFSDHANASRHIPRELERAVDAEIPIIPFRIENVPPRGSLEYNLASLHWLDAITPPVEAHIRHLADSLRAILGDAAAPVVHETPVVREPLVVREPPVVHETLVVQESPVVRELPVVREPLVVREPPVVQEAPVVHEAPRVGPARIVAVIAVLAGILGLAIAIVSESATDGLAFSPAGVIAIDFTLPPAAGLSFPKTRQAFPSLLQTLRAMTGVLAAGSTSELPVSGRRRDRINGRPVSVRAISQDYFKAMGIVILMGRDLEIEDTYAVVVDGPLAAALGGDTAIGMTVTIEDALEHKTSPKLQIVGIVPPMRYAPGAADVGDVYVLDRLSTYSGNADPLLQRVTGDARTVVVRTIDVSAVKSRVLDQARLSLGDSTIRGADILTDRLAAAGLAGRANYVLLFFSIAVAVAGVLGIFRTRSAARR